MIPEIKPLRIGVVGTHNTGKTTILKEIQNTLVNNPSLQPNIRRSFADCDYIEETIRTLSRGYNIKPNEESPLSHQFAIMHLSCVVSSSIDNIVSDRTPLDNLAYFLYVVENSKEIVDENVLRYYKDMAILIAQTFDLFIFCDVLFPLKDDGFRSTNVDFQIDIHNRIEALLLENIQEEKIIRTSEHPHNLKIGENNQLISGTINMHSLTNDVIDKLFYY